MEKKPRIEMYADFLSFVEQKSKREQSVVNHRLFNVLFWCFILPICLSVLFLLAVRVGLLPHRVKGYLDWLILLFPIGFALFTLVSEAYVDFPLMFRRGGMVTPLREVLKNYEWREMTIQELEKRIVVSPRDWHWIAVNFEIDLKRLEFKAKYLTVLGGALFFLLFQGLDILDALTGESGAQVVWTPTILGTWLQWFFNQVMQIVSLLLFLGIFYLSGRQLQHLLERFLHCAQLLSGQDLDSGN